MTGIPIYKKVGRRYHEIGVFDDEMLHFPHGAHLVISHAGGGLTRYNIDPAHAELLAAAETMRKAMMDAILDADRRHLVGAGNRSRALTDRERKGWEAYKAIAGEPQSLYLEGASLHDAIDAGIRALIEAVKESTHDQT